MKVIKSVKTIEEIYEGFIDEDEDGVLGYDEKLNIRPPYQREMVYNAAQQEAVMHSVMNGFPINVMYWVINDKDADGNPLDEDDITYEILDGQQRTMSICRYIDGVYAVTRNGSPMYFHNLKAEEQRQILDYELDVYVCDGTDDERLQWFEVINTAGEKLTPQELRNATYAGAWVTNAKRLFSKTNGWAVGYGDGYITGQPIRQEVLEKVLCWAADSESTPGDNKDAIVKNYMAKYQHAENAKKLQRYFEDVIDWVKKVFPEYNRNMKGIEWGFLYNEYHEKEYDPDEMKKQVHELMADEDVQKKKGVYEFLLGGGKNGGDDSLLRIRAFDESVKQTQYAKQGGKCNICGKSFDYGSMHGDHIVPWSKGGTTTPDNCQMLCTTCNLKKGNQ